MNKFHLEILEIFELLYSNGIRTFETDSFLVSISKKETVKKFQNNWRDEIATFLKENRFDKLEISIFDRFTCKTTYLLNLAPKRLKTLYMEILIKLDVDEHYHLSFDHKKILCNVSRI